MKSLLFVFLTIASIPLFGQTPPNVDCANATELVVGSTPIDGTTIGAPNRSTNRIGGCSVPRYYVYYSVVGTGELMTITTTSITSGFKHMTRIFTGNNNSCSGLTPVVCPNNSSQGTSNQSFISESGRTYYMVVGYWSFNSFGNDPIFGDFRISADSQPIPYPPNDECDDAITLNCGDAVSGSTRYSTAETPPAGCHNEYGVWYTIQGNGQEVFLNTTGSILNMSVMTSDVGCSGPFDVVRCANGSNNSGNLSFDAQTGELYYIYIAYFSGTNTTGGFNLSVTCEDIPPPPANDECMNAIDLTLNTDGSCSLVTTANVYGATRSSQSNECGSNPTYDVWFKFTAPEATIKIGVDNYQGTGASWAISLYEGSCDNLSLTTCSAGGVTLTELTEGQTYYLRVNEFFGRSGRRQNSQLDICMASDGLLPINDECSGAIALPVSPPGECSQTYRGNTRGATKSVEITGDDWCERSHDVWYTFEAPSSSVLINLYDELEDDFYVDAGFQVYSGTCGSLSDDLTGGCRSDNALVENLTPGQTYYLRVGLFENGPFSSEFTLCISTGPQNDDCAQAVAVTMAESNSCNFDFAVTGTVAGATASDVSHVCNGRENDDVWYSFTATGTRANINVNISGEDARDLRYGVYRGDCNNLISLGCVDPNTFSVSNLTLGDTYYLRIFSDFYSSSQTNFQLCIYGPPPVPENDLCTGAFSVVAGTVYEGSIISATSSDAPAVCEGDPQFACSINSPTVNGEVDAGIGVWFSYTATVPGEVILLASGNFNTELQVYEAIGGDCNNLICVASNDDIQTGFNTDSRLCFQSRITPGFTTSTPTTYMIYLDGHRFDRGSYQFQLIDNALPVEYVSFSGRVEGKKNNLHWTVATEINTWQYEVQRSANGVEWETIATLPATGTEHSEESYTVYDSAPLPLAYYRVRGIDMDGFISLSNTISLAREGADTKIIVSPNPTLGILNVRLEGNEKKNGKLTLLNALGQTLHSVPIADFGLSDQITVDLADLPQGIYYLSYENGRQRLTRRVVKK